MPKRKKSKENYFKKSLKTLLDSFKEINLKASFIILADMLFYMAFMLMMFLWNIALGHLFKDFPVESIKNITSLSEEQLGQLAGPMHDVLVSLTVSVPLIILLTIALWSLSKGIIWNLVLKKKFSLSYFWKFSLLNLIWILLWFVPSLFFLFSFKTTMAAFFLVFASAALLYSTPILFIIFTKENIIFKSIKETFKTAFGKIHHFIVPYIIILFSIMITPIIVLPIIYLSQKAYLTIFIIVLFICLAFTRFYLANVVKNIKV